MQVRILLPHSTVNDRVNIAQQLSKAHDLFRRNVNFTTEQPSQQPLVKVVAGGLGGFEGGLVIFSLERKHTISLINPYIFSDPSSLLFKPIMVRTFLKVYMELGSSFLFLQEQIKDIIINVTINHNGHRHISASAVP